MKLYNTLSRSIETFTPMKKGKVSLYSCGPTVYDYQHIGHMRRYVGDDLLKRILIYNGLDVTHVMNITDVGHLVSDADEGEDKMEKGAKKFNMNVWEVAKFFEKQFFDSLHTLDVQQPTKVMHATSYIQQQIALIKKLEDKGFTYKIQDGIYFDTSKFSSYYALSRQDGQQLKKGARIEFVSGKKNISDFALWKFSAALDKRQMEWDSPWGKGFPGWHIECSAMAMESLGETIDIHTGGIDHISIHHTNEIAQSQGATGKQFVRYWVHHNFLTVNGEKMSKSIGNIYTIQDIIEKNFDPLALRYLYMQTHYRQEMNFTWEALTGAQTAYHRLQELVAGWRSDSGISNLEYKEKFLEAMNNDMNMTQVLSLVWEVAKSTLKSEDKYTTLMDVNRVLGLSLEVQSAVLIPDAIYTLVQEREAYRKKGDFTQADIIREKILDLEYIVNDTPTGPVIKHK